MESLNGSRIRLVLVGFVVVLMAAGQLASICLAAQDTWTYTANMSTIRSFFGGGVVDGKIYVIGGAPNNSSVLSAVEMYDPVVDTWTRMANMPSGRCGHAACTFDGKIYVFGGVSPNAYSTAKKNVYVYDPKIDTWTQKADMPYANAYCGIAVVDDTIYLIGGTLSPSSPPIRTVMAYDPITESWTQKADMPTARGPSACVVDGKIYAMGGATENWRVFSYKNVEVYDPSTDTWTRKRDMPTERWGLGTCVVDGKIYAIGGWSGSDACTANEVYDPTVDTWATKSPMQQKRNGAFVCSIADKIYAIGGAYNLPQPTFLLTAEEYGVPSPTEANKALVLRVAELWNTGDLSIADEIFAGDFVPHVPHMPHLTDLESYKAQIIDDRTGKPDLHIEVHDMVAEGDKVAWRLTVSATVQAIGVHYTNTCIVIDCFADGKIVEEWWEFDVYGVYQQLGVITPGRPTPEDYTWGVPSAVTGDPGDTETNKAIALRQLEELCNMRNLAIADEIFSPEFVNHDPVNPDVVDLESFKGLVVAMQTGFPDLHETAEDMVAEGDRVVMRRTATGTHQGELAGIPPTGRHVTMTMMVIFRFADGKIVEAWWGFDMLGLIQQLTGPYCTEPIPGDVNDDCKVDFTDLAIMASHWLQCNLDPPEACWK